VDGRVSSRACSEKKSPWNRTSVLAQLHRPRLLGRGDRPRRVLDLVGAAGLLLAPEPTTISESADGALAVHGSDTVWGAGQEHTTSGTKAFS
jgi:hypothetical protein